MAEVREAIAAKRGQKETRPALLALGVNEVEVSYKEKTAVVTFDGNQTNVAALTAATTDADFPSRPAGSPVQ